MPTLTKRQLSDVPSPSRASKAVQEQHRIYDDFIKAVNSDVGELELGPDEAVRSVKVRLRRAATRLGTDIQIWDIDGKVYFSKAQRRGRPRKKQP